MYWNKLFGKELKTNPYFGQKKKNQFNSLQINYFKNVDSIFVSKIGCIPELVLDSKFKKKTYFFIIVKNQKLKDIPQPEYHFHT